MMFPKRKSDDEPAEKRPIRRAASEARRNTHLTFNTYIALIRMRSKRFTSIVLPIV